MFKKDFVWGVATAAYQIEGAAFEDGRGPSVWDVFSHRRGTTFEGDTGDTACDSYHRWREDVALMKDIGVGAYRFSLSWSRLFPEGRGRLNQKGADYYKALVDSLLENGIEPYVTLFHWDYPYELYLRGGWLNPDSSEWFGEYASAVGRLFGGSVKNYIPFNEPQCFINLGHGSGTHAPGLKLDEPDIYRCAHNVLLSNGKAIRALRAENPNARLGFASCGGAAMPKTETEADIIAAREWMFGGCGLWDNRMWLDPMFLGVYPETLARALGEPKADELNAVAERPDFCGVNIYQADEIKSENGRPVNAGHGAGHSRTLMGWPVTPDCLYWSARFFYERYGLPVFITENGMSNCDVLTPDGLCHDPQRIEYLRAHLSGLMRAASEGIDVGGYFQWSLLDNFEWADGYGQRFGLVYVDYETQKRIPKDSAAFYRDVIRTNGASLEG